MIKENDILSAEFLNFEIFASPELDFSFLEQLQQGQFNTFITCEDNPENKELKSFLENILKAVNLDLNKDVMLLNITDKHNLSFIRLQTKAQFSKAIFFGTDPKSLGINLVLKPYQPVLFDNCHYLLADSLENIQNNVNTKKNLWTCLKEMYLKW